MKFPYLSLICLISLLLSLAAGCTQYQETAGNFLDDVVSSPTHGSVTSSPVDLPVKGAKPAPTGSSPVTTETTASPPVATPLPEVTTPTTTVTTVTTTVTASPTTVTIPATTVTTPPTTVTTPAPEITTPATTVTTPQTTVTTPPTTVTTIPTTTSTPVPGDIPSALERVVFRLTNEERAKEGIPPLVWDDPLAAVARSHSTDMAEHHFFSHTNLQGEGPTERAERMGYPIRKDLGGGYYAVGIGENINQMPTGNVVGFGYVNNDAESIGQAQVKAFMASPGHRALILKAEFTNLGVGAAYDGTYYYTTQNFW